MTKCKLLAAGLAVTSTLGVGAAQAHEAQVNWSLTIGAPVAVLPAPAVVRPAPVVVQPAPYRHYGHHAYRYTRPTAWDRDGDGVPNRYDRLYNPVWDRDGDGIPNGRDHHDNRRHDRDGDGIPNRYDRY